MRTLKSPLRQLHAVAFSPDGAELAAGGHSPSSGNGGVLVWDTATWAAPRHLLAGAEIDAVGYSADGRWLLAAGGTRTDRQDLPPAVRVFDRTRPDAPPHELPGGPRFALAGDRVILAGWNAVPPLQRATSRVAAHRLAPGFPLVWEVEWQTGSLPWGLAGLPDGRAAVLDWYAGHAGLPLYTVILRDADTGAALAVAPPPASNPGPLYTSADGKQVVANAGKSLYVWPTADLTATPKKVSVGQKHCTGLAFAPDGRSVLLTSGDGTVRRLDADSWATAASYSFGAGKALGVAVAPDGLTAAVGSSAGTVVVFDLA